MWLYLKHEKQRTYVLDLFFFKKKKKKTFMWVILFLNHHAMFFIRPEWLGNNVNVHYSCFKH